ncbi:S8 family peptidase [Xylogone sp. PMI_703]|nr:S8 family peptidase [Xylogone sp. PMI_703]
MTSKNSELLASVAVVAWEVMFGLARKCQSPVGANIAVHLHFVSNALESQPIYQLSSEIQRLSHGALRDLLEICTWSLYPVQDLIRLNPQSLYNILVQKFQSDKDQMNKSIEKFLMQKADRIEPDSDQSNPYDRHLNPREEDIYPERINRCLIDTIKKHSTCDPTTHTVQIRDNMQGAWHHTRICLNNGVRMREELAHVELIVAAEGMKFWQEISLDISLKLGDGNGNSDLDSDPESSDSDDEPDRKMVRIKQGTICRMLDEPNYNLVRLQLDENYQLRKYPNPEVLEHFTCPGDGIQLSSLLKFSDLTVEHKINLAHAVARACWQFYSSDLMDVRWSSNDIWFMPVDSQPDSPVPLKAFVSFPLIPYSRSPNEYLEMGDYTHRYPRILFLGIILLEIGFGKALGLEPFDPNVSKLSPVAHTNKAHAKAKMHLDEFKKAKWDSFSYKNVFVEAVENCLESRNFKETRRLIRKQHGRNQTACQDLNDAKIRVLEERKDSLYRKVVAPLLWLANVGFNPLTDVQFITMRRVEQHKSTVAKDEDFGKFWCEMQTPTFDGGTASRIDGWVDRLNVICSHVFRCRRRTKTTTPIRVAILDTGCNKDLNFFQNIRVASCFRGWKDFAADSQFYIDNFGHGSFMVRLVLQVAPFVDLYVAHVAETQDQLEQNEENVAQAIEYAGLDWRVDLISMSFGFPKTSTIISDAIDKVRKERANSIIFLASAGNSSTDRGEAFPARHPSVISIYATDYQGTYLKTNPTKSADAPRLIGTYGDNIPTTIIEEVQKFFPEGDFSPGTSIATAIAAGIVAITLSYTATLPELLQAKWFNEINDKLKTSDGMARMLKVMAVNRDYQGDFINPIGFWSERSKDVEILAAIFTAISGLRS